MSKKKKIRVIILAAGKGERMQSNLPKVLEKVRGKSMIEYLLKSVAKSGIDAKPLIVVGFKKEEVIAKLGAKYAYAVQKEQLGTGHAVMSAMKLLFNKSEHILVLYGDHPLINPGTIKKLVKKHLASGGMITMATAKLPDFRNWRAYFYASFSRIIRDKKGQIVKDIQFKDANKNEKKITEVNPCYFCFDAQWLRKKLINLKNDNAQKQYYLTDLVQLAIQEKTKIESINVNPREALGANSKKELAVIEKFMV